MDIWNDCKTLTEKIKSASWFPYKTGQLRNSVDCVKMPLATPVYRIRFDSSLAPYVSCLEDGTKPHDIPRAFGKPLPFGIGGRFDGKFHPGSMKHKGFISDKTIHYILDYFVNKYNGSIR